MGVIRTMRRRSPWLVGILSAALAVPQGGAVIAQTKPAPATTPPAKPATATASPAKPAAVTAPPPGTNADTGWPRTLTLKSGTAVWYQPQVESWANQKKVVGWAPVSYTPNGAKEPALGTIKIEGDTQVALDDRVVQLDFKISEYNF